MKTSGVSSREIAGARRGETAEALLGELTRAAGPLRRVLAALAGRLTGRRCFEPLGYARLADYARERLGVSPRTVQELARVDARLPELPRLEAALVAGRLPWSKVRLLARFATAESEARFIARAEGASTRMLERELRAVERGAFGAGGSATPDPTEDEEPMEVVSLSVPPSLAFKWHRTCGYAAQVAGETTPPGRVLEWVTGEVLSGLTRPLEDGADAASHTREHETIEPGSVADDEATAEVPHVGAPDAVGADASTTSSQPAELPRFLRPLLTELADADAHELDARLRQAIRLQQRLEAEIAPLLRVVISAEYEWRDRHRTLAAYAREQLGMSPRKARALLRLERAGDRCPELRVAYRDGALSWVQAQSLARLVVGGEAENIHLGVWVEWAQRVSVRRLDETVGRALLRRQANPARSPADEDPEHIADACGSKPGNSNDGASLERQTCARPSVPGEAIRLSVTTPREVARLARSVLCSVRLALERETGRLPTEAEAFEAMLDHALQAWQVEDRWLQNHSRKKLALFERDGWRCTVPGCTSRRSLHLHHIVFRSAGGGDEPENQTTLCAFHHQRGVHAGRLRVSGRAPGSLWFELGTREGKPPLVRYRSGDRIA